MAVLVLALAAQLQNATEQSGRLDAALLDAVRQAAAVEGEARALRNSLAAAEAKADRLEAALLDFAQQVAARETRSLLHTTQEPKPAEAWRAFWRRWLG